MRVAVYNDVPTTTSLPTTSSTSKLPALPQSPGSTATSSVPLTCSAPTSKADEKLTRATTANISIAGGTDAEGVEAGDIELQGVEWVDMANGKVVMVLGWLMWFIIAALNVYLIVMLILGQS
jgi:Mn2+/Fe2+ NRAMP family transporter